MRDKFIFSPWISLSLALFFVVILLGASLVYGIAESLGLMSVIGQNSISLDAYQNLLSGQGAAGQEFWGSLGFSLWVSISSTLISAFIAVLVAVWLSRRQHANSNPDTLALNWNLAFPHLVWSVALILIPLPKWIVGALGRVSWMDPIAI